MADVAKIKADVADLKTAVGTVKDDLVALRATIADLTAKLAAGSPISQADLDQLDSDIVGAHNDLVTAAAIDAPKAAPAPTAPPAG